jgi:hypothetical protein
VEERWNNLRNKYVTERRKYRCIPNRPKAFITSGRCCNRWDFLINILYQDDKQWKTDLEQEGRFFRAPLLLHKTGGPGKPAGLRNGHLLRRGAFATPALKWHRSTNLDTGPEDRLDSSTAPGGR